MKTHPLDKDLAFMCTDRPPVDRGFVAQDSARSVLRIRNAASLVDGDFAAAETLDQNLKWLLKLGGPDVPAFVVEVLHGGLGEPAAKAVWDLLAQGVPVEGPNRSDVRVSVAAYCLANGTVEVLQALVEADVPVVVHPGMFGRNPANRSMWLNMLCTTSQARSHPDFGGLVAHGGLAELAAVNYDYFPEAAQAALELAWAVDREHVGFSKLVEDTSSAGAVARAFVMRKQLETSTVAISTASSPRPRRTTL